MREILPRRGCHQNPARGVDIIRRAAPIGSDDRAAHAHRLEHYRTAAFAQRIEYQRIRCAQHIGAVALRHEAVEGNVIRKPCRLRLCLECGPLGAIAQHIEGDISAAFTREANGFDGEIKPLERDQTAHEDQPQAARRRGCARRIAHGPDR